MKVDFFIKNMFKDLHTIPCAIKYNHEFFLIKNESDLREFCISVIQNNYDLINETIEPDGSNNIEVNNDKIKDLQKRIINLDQQETGFPLYITMKINKEFYRSLNEKVRSQIRDLEIKNHSTKTASEMYEFFISYTNATTLELFQFLWRMNLLHESFKLEICRFTNLSCTEIPHEV